MYIDYCHQRLTCLLILRSSPGIFKSNQFCSCCPFQTQLCWQHHKDVFHKVINPIIYGMVLKRAGFFYALCLWIANEQSTRSYTQLKNGCFSLACILIKECNNQKWYIFDIKLWQFLPYSDCIIRNWLITKSNSTWSQVSWT